MILTRGNFYKFYRALGTYNLEVFVSGKSQLAGNIAKQKTGRPVTINNKRIMQLYANFCGIPTTK